MTGQPYLKWLYEENKAHPVPGESFWSAAIRKLELKLVYNEDALAAWPKTGPLVVVANHPFGVLDGLIVCEIVVAGARGFPRPHQRRAAARRGGQGISPARRFRRDRGGAEDQSCTRAPKPRRI